MLHISLYCYLVLNFDLGGAALTRESFGLSVDINELLFVITYCHYSPTVFKSEHKVKNNGNLTRKGGEEGH